MAVRGHGGAPGAVTYNPFPRMEVPGREGNAIPRPVS